MKRSPPRSERPRSRISFANRLSPSLRTKGSATRWAGRGVEGEFAVLGSGFPGGVWGLTAPSKRAETVTEAALYVLRHPWEVFVKRWNWKAELLSAVFRGVAFCLPAGRILRDDLVRILCIEMAFPIGLGGFWGSLLQSFRQATPSEHGLAYLALRAGHATHITTTSMVISITISAGSLLLNLGLIRRGVLITGA